MKKFTSAFLFLAIIFGAFGLLINSTYSAPPPEGTVRCYFYEPYGGTYHFMAYPQPDFYKGTFPTTASGDPAVEGATGIKPVTSVTVKWASVVEATNSKNNPLTGSEYTAVLSSSAVNSPSITKINNVTVPLSGEYATKIATEDITYTLKIMKAGAEVASCSAEASLVVRWVKPYEAPVPGTASFPAETSYTIPTSKGNVAAATKYAPPIKKLTFYQGNLSTFLGNNNKNIAWIANRYGGGPAGRWNISDPWNPQEPEVVGLSYGPANNLGRGQPPEHKGPWNNANYPHSGYFQGAIFADLPSSEGRFVIAPAITANNDISAVLQMGVGFGTTIGQVFQEKWMALFGREQVGEVITMAVDATSTGRFFMFGGGANSPDLSNQVYTFDISTLDGSTETVNGLKPSSTVAWSNITELEVIEVKGVKNHFLIGRSGPRSGTAIYTEKPKMFIGEIDADTGRIVRQNAFELDLTGVATRNIRVLPGSNIQSARVGNNTFVFVNESFSRSNQAASAQSPGTLKLAAYKFDPQNLKFIEKGKISLANFPGFNYADSTEAWTVSGAQDGQAYPLLVTLAITAEKTYVNSYGETITQPALIGQNIYELKKLIDAAAPVELAPTPDIKIDGKQIPRPLTMGLVVPNGPDIRGPLHTFLKKENGKVNLYMYIQALIFDGRHGGDPVMPYDEGTATGLETHWGDDNWLSSSFAGPITMKIDRIDVTGFTGGAYTPSPVTPPVPVDNGCSTGGTYSTTTGVPCVCYTQQFVRGATGDAVKALQQKLKDAGLYQGRVDGIYGPLTSAAEFAYCRSVLNPTYTPGGGGGGNNPPTISSIQGPSSLAVNQMGSWKAIASDPNLDDLSWGVNWGEGRSLMFCKLSPGAGTSKDWTYEASHAWSQPGTYTFTVYVNDCKGGSTSQTFSVNVTASGGGGGGGGLNQNAN